MRRAGLAAHSCGKPGRRLITVTGLVRRDGPDQLRVTGITGHPAREGKLYCYVVPGVWSRRVTGRASGAAQRAGLATSTPRMATGSRGAAGGIIHGDHGIQTSRAFTGRAAKPARCPCPAASATLRQRRRRIFPGPHANRAAQPTALEHPRRARERDLRVHRRLP
jgi:putative transposase